MLIRGKVIFYAFRSIICIQIAFLLYSIENQSNSTLSNENNNYFFMQRNRKRKKYFTKPMTILTS